MPVIDLFGFLNCIYGLSISAYLWYRGDASAKYLTISWLVLIVTTFILMLSLTGIKAYQIELHYLQNLGVVIEVLLLSTALAEMLRKRAEAEPVTWLGEKIAYTVSIGTISLVPDMNTSTQAIIKRTDDALYHAKAQGRNCIVEASSAFTQSVSSA